MNRIQTKIRQVFHSGGILMVDMETESCLMTALLIDAHENPAWLKAGNTIYAVFKETEVSLAKNFTGRISLRNRIPCRIEHIERGELMSVITLFFHQHILFSAITTRSVDMLELKTGDEVTALIKANEITLMQI
jgi:molybdate transport system regulatory protein